MMTDELNQILTIIKLLEFTSSFSTNSCKQMIQTKLRVIDFLCLYETSTGNNKSRRNTDREKLKEFSAGN